MKQNSIMPGKKIGMVLNSFYPSDIRVKKEARTLLDAGYQVFLLCYRRKGQKEYEILEGIHIQRVYIGESKWMEGIWDVVNSCFFYHPVIGRALKKFIGRYGLHILHVHDLPLAGTAIRMAGRHNVRLVLDFHENYPEAMKVWFNWRKNPVIRLKNRLFFNYRRWFEFEKRAVTAADRVIAVVDEMKQRLIRDHQLPESDITVLPNSESKDFITKRVDEDVYGELADKYILLYAGYIGPHRGVDTVIQAMGHLRPYLDEIYFVVVGTASRDVMNELREMACELGVDSNVVFKGYQPFDRFYSYMSQASVNVIPHKKNGHTDHTIPHKIYQAMMTGKPVLASSCDPLERTVREHQSGEVFESENASDCAQKILRLYRDRNYAARLGRNGKTATVEGTLNWESDARALLELYEELLG
ncbi:MAG: glycosyltransferase family 4 protein [Balneolaceae bacterium]